MNFRENQSRGRKGAVELLAHRNHRSLTLAALNFAPARGIFPKNFMHLCELYRYQPGKLSGYGIYDTKGMFAKYGDNNVHVRWSDFRQAPVKYTMKAPPEKPSVFQGERYSLEHATNLRKRSLAAAMREYISSQNLAEDVLEWLSRGREDDLRKFVIAILYGVGWFNDPPQTPEAAADKPVQRPPDGMILMMR